MNLELGNNNAIIIVINTFFCVTYVGCYYVALLNHDLVSRAKLCLVSLSQIYGQGLSQDEKFS